MDPALWRLLESDRSGEVEAIIRLTPGSQSPSGVRLVATFGDIATCRLKSDDILETRAASMVDSLKASRLLQPELVIDLEENEPIADLYLDERRPPGLETTGLGVVVGIVDWGCDFAHPDFRHPDGRTRLLAIWDQRGPSSPDSPQPYNYGRIYTSDDINQALEGDEPYAALGYHPADGDPDGTGSHGTHVLSIAAGNGRGGGPIGMAPNADLIFVHLTSRQIGGLANLGDSVTLLEAVDFIAREAGDRSWVINLSVGRHGGPHDGSTLVEQGLDHLIAASPGRCIVQSCGNYFDQSIHTAGLLRPGENHCFYWHVDAADRTPNELEIWYPRRDVFLFEIRPPGDDQPLRLAQGEQASLIVDGREVGRAYHRQREPNNGNHHIDVFLDPGGPAGSWEIRLLGEDVTDGRFHAWVERDASCPGCQSRFDPEDSDPRTTTGTICNGFRTIAVGAYNGHSLDRELAYFSSSGPTLDGRQKPDCLAPGVRVLAARSASAETYGSTSLYTRKSGTSMAAPYVTGTVACLMEAAGKPLTIQEMRAALLANAEHTGEDVPLVRAGSGYIDVEAAVEAVAGLAEAETAPVSASVRPQVIGVATALVSDPFPPALASNKALEIADLSETPLVESEGWDGLDSATSEQWEAFASVADQSIPVLANNGPRSTEESIPQVAPRYAVEKEVSSMNRYRAVARTQSLGNWMEQWEAENGSRFPNPAFLFDVLTNSGSLGPESFYSQMFEVIAGPGEPLAATLMPGDLLIRRALGEGRLATLNLLEDGQTIDRADLPEYGFVPDSVADGLYAVSDSTLARRLADASGQLGLDTLILRSRTFASEFKETDCFLQPSLDCTDQFESLPTLPHISKPSEGRSVPESEPNGQGHNPLLKWGISSPNSIQSSVSYASQCPNSEGQFPPLPDPLTLIPELPDSKLLTLPTSIPESITVPLPRPPIPTRSVRCGCYLINYKPSRSSYVLYDGTLRVECHSNGRTVSGDLYQRPFILLPSIPLRPILQPGPNPTAGIPILARSRYRYYLRVTQILEHFTFGNSFTLGFEMWRFTKSRGGWSTGGTWTNEGAFTALMTWQAAPAGYPSSGNYLEGDVKNRSGVISGRLTMGWVSQNLRKATIEIDRVPQSETALNNGAGVDWRVVGNGISWDITVDESDSNVAEPSGQSWSDAECHAAMLARRDASNLDTEWRYHVLCVRLLDSTSRGIMYDAYGGDSNNVPREGCAISSHWTIPNTPEWGLVQGMRFGTATAPYFRTAVHETGHAMGLYHNTADNGFMNTTNVIANNSLTAGTPAFPNNVLWSYNSEDSKRLRHMPDIYVRPGGIPFGTSYATIPISPTDLGMEVEALELQVRPLLESVPLGAPIRINIELTNITREPVFAPTTLSMKSGFVKGKVIDPSGAVRTFSPILRCVEEHLVDNLNPMESLSNSITLLRGAQGALFPMPGVYRITVEVHWDSNGVDAVVSGETSTMVTSAADDAHAQAALKVLSTPDTLLTLVLGGDHLTSGIEAIHAALENPILRPHFAYVEAKRIAERFGKRKPNLEVASELIDDSTVMSPAEVKRTVELVKTEGADSTSGKNIAETLKRKVSMLKVSREIQELVDAL